MSDPQTPRPDGSDPGLPKYPSSGSDAYYGATSGTPSAPIPPHVTGVAHKPGVIPLRPLNLGDIYDGAFRVIRFNPKATVGPAVLVASVAMLIPVIISAIVTFTVGATLPETDFDPNATDSEMIGSFVAFGSAAGGAILLQLGLIFVTGMVAHVANAAAVGQRMTLGAAWAATRGNRWKLLGLVAVLTAGFTLAVGIYVGLWFVVIAAGGSVFPVVFGLVTVPALFAAMFWFWVRVYYLPAPILMLEDVGVFEAIRRGYALTHGQFWRIFGIGLLTLLITSIASGILSVPITIGGDMISASVPEYEVLGFAITQALGSILSSAFVAPFAALVTTLLYIDQRMRKEAFDVELMTRAGINAA